MRYRHCFCLNRKEDKRLAEFGLKRAMKQLEVDQFIKSQMRFRIVMKALFTKVEQFLIKNNHKFVLSKSSEKHIDTSSSEDRQKNLKDLLTSLDKPHPYMTHLLRNSSS